jgi:hypothetical protein
VNAALRTEKHLRVRLVAEGMQLLLRAGVHL